ncbi:hypothetical protein VNI00_013900 [Paramarasmius palmivorus]|uniref:Uncharacterized protein n=1 Tax=Paramarasmius palmivorus TaxID=297713 RepID=A0AAW0BW86_9AGAR
MALSAPSHAQEVVITAEAVGSGLPDHVQSWSGSKQPTLLLFVFASILGATSLLCLLAIAVRRRSRRKTPDDFHAYIRTLEDLVNLNRFGRKVIDPESRACFKDSLHHHSKRTSELFRAQGGGCSKSNPFAWALCEWRLLWGVDSCNRSLMELEYQIKYKIHQAQFTR